MYYRNCLFLALFIFDLCQADTLPEMSTDRPDFTESTEAIPRGLAQYESGFVFEHSRTSRENSIEAPSSLLRIGLGRNLELRVGGEGLCWSRHAGAGAITGFSDHEVSVKAALTKESRYRPAVAVITIMSFPIGSEVYSSGGFDPEVKLALSKELPAGFGIGGNVNFAWITDGSARFHQRAYSLTAGHGLARGVEAYWEVYAIGPAVMVNTGMARALGKNVRVDVEVGRAVHRSDITWFAGFGIAFRHDLHAFAGARAGGRIQPE